MEQLDTKQCNWIDLAGYINGFRYYETSLSIRKKKPQSWSKRMQFPTALAYASTVLEVQGINLPSGVISFDQNRQKIF